MQVVTCNCTISTLWFWHQEHASGAICRPFILNYNLHVSVFTDKSRWHCSSVSIRRHVRIPSAVIAVSVHGVQSSRTWELLRWEISPHCYGIPWFISFLARSITFSRIFVSILSSNPRLISSTEVLYTFLNSTVRVSFSDYLRTVI